MDSELLWHIVSKFLSTAYCAAYNLLTGTRLRERSYHEVLGLAKQDIQFADPQLLCSCHAAHAGPNNGTITTAFALADASSAGMGIPIVLARKPQIKNGILALAKAKARC
jgi:hypothetical protein